MQTCILKLWQDREILHDMEDLVLNYVEIPVENQDIKVHRIYKFQDVEIFQDLEDWHHTHYILKPLL